MANLKYKNNSNEWKSILSTRGPKGDNADITVNGSNLKEASFYAPISSGLTGQTLISKGANQSPQWTNLAVVAGTNSYNDLDNKPTIPTTTEELISGSASVLTSGGAYNAFAQRGIPSGGTEGQIIKKASATDYDFSWADACIDNLVSTSAIIPLSANQGKILNGKITDLTTTFNSWKTPHVTEIVSAQTKTTKTITNGYNNSGYLNHSLRTKIGTGNEMYEYYGGIYIPSIEKYSVLFVELNCGGHTSGTNSQFNGGIVLWKGNSGIEDSDYHPGWQNYILPPSTNNYWKGCITKIIIVGNRTGAYCVGSVWNAYSGNDFEWNAGFGDEGSTLKVVGILK